MARYTYRQIPLTFTYVSSAVTLNPLDAVGTEYGFDRRLRGRAGRPRHVGAALAAFGAPQRATADAYHEGYGTRGIHGDAIRVELGPSGLVGSPIRPLAVLVRKCGRTRQRNGPAICSINMSIPSRR
ncbi:MAG: hypothetical protein QOE61_4376 [Micromonosporaceae bacterium]|nr:hypothetical protein [Micromonosporaceae bacterium]